MLLTASNDAPHTYPYALEAAQRQVFRGERIFDVRWLIEAQGPIPVRGVPREWRAPVHATSSR